MHRYYKVRGTPDCPIAVYQNSKLVRLSHWHPEVEIMMITCGTVNCRLEAQNFHLCEGDILIINPNQAHTVVNFSKDHRYLNVIFSTDGITMPEEHIFQKLFVAPLSDGRLQLPNLLQPSHPAYEEIKRLLLLMPEGSIYQEESKFYRYTRLIALCAALHPYCTLTQATDHRQFPEERSVRKAMIYIHNLYHKPLSLEEIAAHVHLHPNYLSNIFKTQVGHTVTEHIARTRVDAARFILRRDMLPMARVAELSGFPSERAFYRQFKKITGMSPKEYQIQQTRPDR